MKVGDNGCYPVLLYHSSFAIDVVIKEATYAYYS